MKKIKSNRLSMICYTSHKKGNKEMYMYLFTCEKKITEKINQKLVRRVTVVGCYGLPKICPCPNSQNL